MRRFLNIENTTIVEQAEVAGAAIGFLGGAAAGANVAGSLSWYNPAVMVGGALVGGVVGAVGGANLGRAIATHITRGEDVPCPN